MTDKPKKEKLSTTENTKRAKSASGGKVSVKVQKLVDEVAKLSVIELSELVNSLQDKLGVETPVAAAVAAPSGQAAPEATAEEAGQAPAAGAKQTVTMTAAGDKKIEVIKALRAINQNLGLKEAKDMTENLPAEILKEAKAEEAKEAADKLKAAGASVELK